MGTIKVGGKGPFDKEMILAARRATRGSKNVVVSMDDAKQIFEAARPDGNSGRSSYDKVEKETTAYIRKNYKFTEAADDLLRKMFAEAGAAQAKRTKAKNRMNREKVVGSGAAQENAMKAVNTKVIKKTKKRKATKEGVLKRINAQKSFSKTVKIGGKNYDKEMILAARRATR